MFGSPAGSQVEWHFRPCGFGRFFGAPFLSVWLAGWAAGEGFAILMIGHGAYALLTGRPAIGSDHPLQLAPALAVGGFLLFWLTFWTLGGIMALRELLRMLWAYDHLLLDRETLTHIHRLGPFTFTRRFNQADIRRVFLQQCGSRPSALMAQIGANVIEWTALGTPAQRDAAAHEIRAALGLAEESTNACPAALPDDWQVITGPYNELLLVPNLKTRRTQARLVSGIAIAAGTVATILAWQSLTQPNLWVITIMLTAAAVALGRAAFLLHRGRKEWRIERGKLFHQRRLDSQVTELAEARTLELTESSDSDGDRWYYLHAIEWLSADFPAARGRSTPRQLKIAHALHDPSEPRSLGLWLAQNAGIPFHDRIPNEASRQAEITRLCEQLANSGKLGRFLLRLLPRSVK
jgi:hypothetical protein